MPDVARGEGDFRNTPFGLPASGNGARKFSVVRDDQDAGVTKTIPSCFRRSGLEFFRFFDERKQTLGADSQIDGGFGVLGALGMLHAALEVGNFRFGKRER